MAAAAASQRRATGPSVELLTRLRRQPFIPGEFRETDDTGRTNEVVLVGDMLIFFWSDHAVKTVRVPKVEFDEGD